MIGDIERVLAIRPAIPGGLSAALIHRGDLRPGYPDRGPLDPGGQTPDVATCGAPRLAAHDVAVAQYERVEAKVDEIHQAIKIGFANMAALVRGGGE